VAAVASPAVERNSPAWLDDATLAAVRPQVRQLLERSPSFRALPKDEQRGIARTMVRVASYMSNPQGLARKEFERAVTLRPEFAEAYTNLGQAYLELKGPGEAIAALEKAVALERTHLGAHGAGDPIAHHQALIEA
jgi:tetratricopeptide (TPR) repeat protein